MNETTIVNDKQENNMTDKGPGSQLRTAREALKITVDDAAKHLHLMPSVIRQIENNQFQQGKGNLVFIRGYLRFYAKFLNLSQEQIIGSFNDLNIDEPEDNLINHFIYKGKKKASSEYLFEIMSALIILGLLVIAFVWWHSQYSVANIIHNMDFISHLSPNKNSIANKESQPSSQSQSAAPRLSIDQTGSNVTEKTFIVNVNTLQDSASNTTQEKGNTLTVDQHTRPESTLERNKLEANNADKNANLSTQSGAHATNAMKRHSVRISPPFQ